MNYTTFDEHGRINGNWPHALYPPTPVGRKPRSGVEDTRPLQRHKKVPVGAVELPQDTVAKLLEYPDAWRWNGSDVVAYTPPPAALTAQSFGAAIQAHMDAVLQQHGYDSINTAITYRDDPNPKYAAEGQAAFEWRSAVWTYATAELDRVTAGERQVPTVEEFIAELPDLNRADSRSKTWSIE